MNWQALALGVLLGIGWDGMGLFDCPDDLPTGDLGEGEVDALLGDDD